MLHRFFFNNNNYFTHHELLDPSTWSFGVVPEPDLGHSAWLVKYHIDTVDSVGQYWCEPHVPAIPTVIHTIHKLVYRPQVTFDPWEDIDAIRECSNI